MLGKLIQVESLQNRDSTKIKKVIPWVYVLPNNYKTIGKPLILEKRNNITYSRTGAGLGFKVGAGVAVAVVAPPPDFFQGGGILIK